MVEVKRIDEGTERKGKKKKKKNRAGRGSNSRPPDNWLLIGTLQSDALPLSYRPVMRSTMIIILISHENK